MIFRHMIKTAFVALVIVSTAGCRTAVMHRHAADRAAQMRLQQAQAQALGSTEALTVERPADTLRRRLLLDQLLPHGAETSLGTRDLPPNRFWDPARHLDPPADTNAVVPLSPLTLEESLRVGAANSREFQDAKETLYRSALDLDLEADAFRHTFAGMLSGTYASDSSGEETVESAQGSSTLGITRKFRNGAELSGSIMVDVVKLLTQEPASSLGLMVDTSISIPLLRGSGRDIAGEPLRQAEKNLLYAVYTFERFKRTFAVQLATDYLSVQQDRQAIRNAEENYKRLVAASRRARRLADAGRLPEFQFDQAVQDELRARTRWINARQRYASSLDAFKLRLGLPPDADIALDPSELKGLEAGTSRFVADTNTAPAPRAPAVDGSMKLREPDTNAAGPLEMEPEHAIRLALESRLDLRVAEGRVEDAQRKVHVAADALRAELTLLGRAQAGERRNSAGSAGEPDARIDPADGLFSGLITLDPALERTAERTTYRKRLITLEEAVRNAQLTEDRIKLDVLDDLRRLVQSRENLLIQRDAVRLAEKRVASTDLLLQAGRAQIRDVLESQEALLNAQNALIAAMVSYRISELSLQRDMGLLEVSANGLWSEYTPGEKNQ